MVVIWFLCDLFRPDSKLSCMEALALQPQISHLIRCSHFGRAVQLVCECVNSVYVAQAIIENGSDEMKTLGAKERTKVSNSNRHEDRMWKSNWECSNTCYKLNKIGFLSIVCGFVVTFFRFCSLSLPRSPLYFFDIFIFLIHCWYSFSRTVTIRFRLFLRVIFPFAWMRLYFFIWLVCWHLVPQHKRLFAIILWIPLCLFSFLFVVVAAAAAAGAAVVVVLALFLIILWTTTVRSSFCFSFPHLHHVIAWKFAVDFFHFFFRRTVWVHSLRKWHSERERERGIERMRCK